ncbi:MAG TPA: hypothetical protein VL400_10840 [Polyangiaceae bacterium]|nr:hypothetical protein [Polyangiaceae bacterium]
MSKRALSMTVALCVGAGCGGETNGAAPAGSGAASSAKPAASMAGASAAASGAPSAPAPAAGGFAIVAEGAGLAIHPMGGAGIADLGAFYALLGDGPIEQDPMLTKTAVENDSGGVTVTNAVFFSSFRGAWPKPAFGESSISPGLLGRVNDTWTKQDPLRENERLLDVTTWGDGKALAAIRMEAPDLRFQLVGSSGGVPVPAPGKPTADQTDCNVRFDPDGGLLFSGTSSSHLFAIGKECKTGKPIAEHWAPKEVHGTAAPVDGVDPAATPGAVAAASDSEAYAVFNKDADGFLATFDGKAWKAEASPFGAAKSLFVAQNGTTFAVGAKGLFEHPKGGAWAAVPGGEKATSAWAKNDDVVWVVLDGKKLAVKGVDGGATITLPSSSDVRATVDRDKRWPATAACKKVYVQLTALGPAGGAPPKSYAGLTDVVKADPSLKEGIDYVVEEQGNQFAGAKVPSLDVANKLVAAFKAKNPKANPLVFCHVPAEKGKLSVE